MTREDFYSIFIYILMAVIILVTGFTVIRPAMEEGYLAVSAGSNFAFLLLALIISVLINVILLEIGHLIGAKLGGYNVILFNILGLCFYKKEENGKLVTKFNFKSFDGFTGETLIEPKKDKSNPMFYVFIPLILMLLEFVALYCVMTFIPSSTSTDQILLYVKYGVVVLAAIAGCFIVYNYFPARMDTLTDGYRLVLLNKKVNVEAYNLKLEVEANKFFNRPVKELEPFTVITDFTARTNMEIVLNKLEQDKYDEASNIIDLTLKEDKNISRSTKVEFLLTKAYLMFMNEELEEASKFYIDTFDNDMKSKIRSCKDYSEIRVYILYEGLVEKTKSEIDFAIDRKKKLDKKVSDGEAIKEGTLINKALEKVYSVNPELKDGEKKEA